MQIGADIEEFVLNSAGQYIASTGLIGGSKTKPLLVPRGNLQEDNVTAEYAIEPAGTEDAFIASLRTVRASMQERLSIRGNVLGTGVVHKFDTTYLNSIGAPVLISGCDPEFDAWSGQEMPRPDMSSGLRSCGGHVHFDASTDAATFAARMMDYRLGLWSLQYDQAPRRTLYGKAGAWRPKPYGGEYRVLSNFWALDEQLAREVYRRTVWSVENESRVEEFMQIVSPAELQAAINACEWNTRTADMLQAIEEAV